MLEGYIDVSRIERNGLRPLRPHLDMGIRGTHSGIAGCALQIEQFSTRHCSIPNELIGPKVTRPRTAMQGK
jgi:hypothetical protein